MILFISVRTLDLLPIFFRFYSLMLEFRSGAIAGNVLVYRQVARDYGCGFVGITIMFVMKTNLVLFYKTRHLRYTLLLKVAPRPSKIYNWP